MALRELVDRRREEPARAVVHVLDRVDAKAVEVREGDPELEALHRARSAADGAVVVDRARALLDVFQVSKSPSRNSGS